MVLSVILSVFILFVTVSSLVLDKAIHIPILIFTAVLFILLVLLEKKYPRIRYLQLILLGIFHWASQLNWVMAVYLMIAAKEINYQKGVKYRVMLFSGLAILYTLIRLSYIEHTLYNFLVIFSDWLGFITVALFIGYIIKLSQHRQVLLKENEQLTKYDSETSLLNFQTFQIVLDDLTLKKEGFKLIILDCTDINMKTVLNKRSSVSGGSDILKEVATFLQNSFPQSYAISRYGRDEFSIILHNSDTYTKANLIHTLLEVLPKQLGVETTFGLAAFPKDAETKDDLIRFAEKKLFEMKRERWLQQEERIFQEEKLKMVGELAAGLAHEIRNPLTTVKGFIQVSSASGYNIEPWYDVIMEEITRVNQLTVEFLQFSKPHASQFKLTAIHECVERVINLMESEASLQGHQIDYENLMEKPIYCFVDRDKIVQVLINLLKNAFQAMENNGRVKIRVYQEQQQACIEVQDYGPGISEGVLEQIYNPFFTTKEEGTGLGLPICHKILQDHQGTLSAVSELNVGTTFTVTLPLSKQDIA